MAWFTLVHLIEPPDAKGSYGALANRESGDAWTHCWDNLCTKFSNVFELLAMLQKCKIKHGIKLFPDSTLPSK